MFSQIGLDTSFITAVDIAISPFASSSIRVYSTIFFSISAISFILDTFNAASRGRKARAKRRVGCPSNARQCFAITAPCYTSYILKNGIIRKIPIKNTVYIFLHFTFSFYIQFYSFTIFVNKVGTRIWNSSSERFKRKSV